MFFTTFNKKILFFTATYTLLSFCSVNKAYAGVAKEYMNDPRNSLSINIKKQIKNKQGFIRKYINPEENQIFGDKNHLLSFFSGYGSSNKIKYSYLNTRTFFDLFELYSYGEATRKYFTLNLNYSIPLKLFYINGRLTFGIFGTYINQNIGTYCHGWDVARGELETTTIGVEGVYEVILGHPNLYFTAGVGASYMFILSTKVKTNNIYFNARWDYYQPKILWNNTLFNFVVKASVGHRFDSGVILEANWKHYTNAGISEYNWEFNYFGLTIGVVF